jgi:hypothetical protein
MVIGLLVKPLVRGKADMDNAPIKPKAQVNGIVLYNPPKLVHLLFPVINYPNPN